MRIFACWLMGSVMVAPLSCGSSTEKATPAPAKSTATTSSAKKSTSPTVTGSQQQDPLVPAIDLGPGFSADATSLTATEIADFDFTSDNRATFHAHGNQVCASGCAASRHPTAELTKAKYLWLIRRFAEQPMTAGSPALEKLLYFGRQTSVWINKLGTGSLGNQRAEFLRRELKRTHALVYFRIVDEHGVVRVHIPPTRVPLDRRHVFRMETKDLPPLITSGTVKRVGLHHLWTRL